MASDADPPPIAGCLQDWLRLPGDERDIAARVALLRLRAHVHGASPELDAEGRLHYRGWVRPIPPDELELARVLVAHFGHVVSDVQFAGPPTQLRTHMARLRAMFRPFGLAVRRAAGRGYVLEEASPARRGRVRPGRLR